ncbi:hypothetical protein ABKN59_011495 [Abortiporus biennis]
MPIPKPIKRASSSLSNFIRKGSSSSTPIPSNKAANPNPTAVSTPILESPSSSSSEAVEYTDEPAENPLECINPLARDLPNEIIIQIFNSLYYEMSRREVFVRISSDSVPVLRKIRASYREARMTICAAMMANRQWYSVGKSVFYRRVLLLSHSQIDKFRSTLEKNESLAEHVKGLSFYHDERPVRKGQVLDVGNGGEATRSVLRHSPRLKKRRVDIFGLHARRMKRMKKDLVSILDILPDLRAFTVEHQFVSHEYSVSLFARRENVFSNLRKLSIRSSKFFPFFHALNFQNLQTITLESFTYASDMDWPSLPRLQTLRLINLVVKGRMRIARPDVPLLVQVEVQNCDLLYPPDFSYSLNQPPPSHLTVGQRFDKEDPSRPALFTSAIFVGLPQYNAFPTFLEINSLSKLQHLTLGIDRHSYMILPTEREFLMEMTAWESKAVSKPARRLRDWDFPETLKTLTLFMVLSMENVLVGSSNGLGSSARIESTRGSLDLEESEHGGRKDTGSESDDEDGNDVGPVEAVLISLRRNLGKEIRPSPGPTHDLGLLDVPGSLRLSEGGSGSVTPGSKTDNEDDTPKTKFRMSSVTIYTTDPGYSPLDGVMEKLDSLVGEIGSLCQEHQVVFVHKSLRLEDWLFMRSRALLSSSSSKPSSPSDTPIDTPAL